MRSNFDQVDAVEWLSIMILARWENLKRNLTINPNYNVGAVRRILMTTATKQEEKNKS